MISSELVKSWRISLPLSIVVLLLQGVPTKQYIDEHLMWCLVCDVYPLRTVVSGWGKPQVFDRCVNSLLYIFHAHTRILVAVLQVHGRIANVITTGGGLLVTANDLEPVSKTCEQDFKSNKGSGLHGLGDFVCLQYVDILFLDFRLEGDAPSLVEGQGDGVCSNAWRIRMIRMIRSSAKRGIRCVVGYVVRFQLRTCGFLHDSVSRDSTRRTTASRRGVFRHASPDARMPLFGAAAAANDLIFRLLAA